MKNNRHRVRHSRMLRLLALTLMLTLNPLSASASSVGGNAIGSETNITTITSDTGSGERDASASGEDDAAASSAESSGSESTDGSSSEGGSSESYGNESGSPDASASSESSGDTSETSGETSGSSTDESGETGSSESTSGETVNPENASGDTGAASESTGTESTESTETEAETKPVAPGKVTLTGIQPGEQIDITWSQAANAEGYYIYRKTSGGSWTHIGTVTGGSVTTYADKTVKENITYTYTVRAWMRNASGQIIKGSYDTKGLSASLAISVPKLKKVTGVSGSVYLYWDTRSHKSGGFQIARRTGSGSWKVIETISNKTQNIWHDTSAVPGVTYTYRIRSWYTKNSKKVYSSYATSSAVTCRPSQPLIKSVTTNSGKTSDKVTWYTLKGVTGYIVYKKNSSTDGKWVRVKTIKATAKAITQEYNVPRDKSVSGVTTYMLLSYVTKNGRNVYSEGIDSLSNAPKKLSGKKMLFLGDSVSYGRAQVYKTRLPYPARIGAVTGATVDNQSISASILSRLNGYYGDSITVLAEKGKISFKGYDIICIAIGTNDFHHNVKIGSVTDTKDTTFYGAWNVMFKLIRKQNPKAKVVLITPSYRGRRGSDYTCVGFSAKNPAGYTLRNYADATQKIAKKYGALVFVSEKSKVITASNYAYRLFDCSHPTDEIYACFGNEIAAWLLKNL